MHQVFGQETHPVAREIFALLKAEGLVSGDGWELQESYGYRSPLSVDAAGEVRLILFYSGGREALLSVDTEAAETADRLEDWLDRVTGVLDASGRFRRLERAGASAAGETPDSGGGTRAGGEVASGEAHRWQIPSMARGEGGWDLETRAWGTDVRVQILDEELLDS